MRRVARFPLRLQTTADKVRKALAGARRTFTCVLPGSACPGHPTLQAGASTTALENHLHAPNLDSASRSVAHYRFGGAVRIGSGTVGTYAASYGVDDSGSPSQGAIHWKLRACRGTVSTSAVVRGKRAARVLALCGFMAFAGASTARAATATFESTGTEQTFTVPAVVTTLHIVAVGGRGGSPGGGFGATATGDVPVVAGQVLYIEVAGNGSSGQGAGYAPGGFNGGGNSGRENAAGGGGASDVRTAPSSSPGSLTSRLIVAAGGGGAAHFLGGAAGAPAYGGGGAGTATMGGAGAGTGAPGTLGDGGGGGEGSGGASGGGGGGGGLYGGGGGGGGYKYEVGPNTTGGTGGGGGSSGFAATVVNTAVGADTTGVPMVTITYEVPPALPQVPTALSPSRPSLTGASLTNRRFRVAQENTVLVAKAPLGTSFRFALSAPSKLQIAITKSAPGLRRGHSCLAPTATLRRSSAKRCTRILKMGTLTRLLEPAGADRVAFTGRIGHRPLSPGAYTAVLTASNTGGLSTPVALTFTIVH
jgi:Glycine rich protein